MKKLLAVFLTVVMTLGMVMPGASAIEVQQTGDGIRSATEVAGASRLDEFAVGETDHIVEPLYRDDEIVTVIVRLEGASALDYFEQQTYSADLTAGQAVASYLSSPEAQATATVLKADQQDVINSIQRAMPASSYGTATASVEVVAQWTLVANAMAVKVPYGQLETIRSIPGVADAYVETVFAIPEPSTDAGTAGYSYDMIGIDGVWDAGYTGENMLVAVLDTGLDLEMLSSGALGRVHEAFTEDSFKNDSAKSALRYTSESMATFLQANALRASSFGNSSLLYKNMKVPFAADYADEDLNARHISNNHGTHVAGTIGGYVETAEGEVKFSGIAPDAQFLIMKVFSDYSSGAYERHIISALEDAAVLGADVMNLSLGSDNGFVNNDTLANEVYNRLSENGILFMISAGNSDHSANDSHYGIDYNLITDPEISMVGSPSVYEGALSVASINNTITFQPMMTWKDTDGTEHKIVYNDTTENMKAAFGSDSDLGIKIIPVGDLGSADGYAAAGFRNWDGTGEKGVEGIALVKRGTLAFTEKILNGEAFVWNYTDPTTGEQVTTCPVKGVLIYDNTPTGTTYINMAVDGTHLPSAFINGVDGEALAAAAAAAAENGTYVTLKNIDLEDTLAPLSTAGEMSPFTSWGATPSLELKPEITAPGGNIWSTVMDTSTSGGAYTGTYSMMSGTSMAAPHMTGVSALVLQYVRTTLGISDIEAAADLADNLMVSTAVPQIGVSAVTGRTAYYSPRQQGAGLVNAAAAVTTPAYITVDGQRVGKLEFKDDPQRTGTYTFEFTVNNLTNRELTYTGEIALMIPEFANAGVYIMLDSDMVYDIIDIGTITVPANGSKTVTYTLTLTEDDKATLDNYFTNGTYLEGFVTLTSTGTDPQIGLPFLGFYGDWTAAPIFDAAVWANDGYYNELAQWGVTEVGYYDSTTRQYFTLGQNPFDPTAARTQYIYPQENMTVSPGGLFPSINDYTILQKRDARAVVVEVKDAVTGELYYRDWATYQFKTSYSDTYQMIVSASMYSGNFTATDWDGTDLNGNLLPSGTQCVMTITAYGDGEYPMTTAPAEYGYTNPITDFEAVYPGGVQPTFNGHAMDMTGDVISTLVRVDYAAPVLENRAVSIYEQDGRVYMTGTFVDDGSLASVAVYPEVKCTYKDGYGDPSYTDIGVDFSNPFADNLIFDPAVGEYTFTADVTEYVHTNEDFDGQNSYYDFAWTGNVYIYGGDYGGNDRAYAVTVKDTSVTTGLSLSPSSAVLYVGETVALNVINNTASAEFTFTSADPEIAVVDENGMVQAVSVGQTDIIVTCGDSEAVCGVIVREMPTEVVDFNLSIAEFDGLKPVSAVMVKVTDLYPADVAITENNWVITGDDSGLVTVAPADASGLAGMIFLASSVSETEVPGGSATLEVTINGVKRTMTIDWEDLYTAADEEDLISALGEQVIYVNPGETAELVAQYKNESAHGLDPEDGLYGPFDWTVISGEGVLELKRYDVENVGTLHTAEFTPAALGVSYITATTKDGAYSVKFAVVCEDNKVETINIDNDPAFLYVGKTYPLSVSQAPMPTLAKNQSVVWFSSNPDVVSVDENGVLTALSVGHAVITVTNESSGAVDSFLVQVTLPAPDDTYTVVFNTMGGTPVPSQEVKAGKTALRPDDPTYGDYIFRGWYLDPGYRQAYSFSTPVTQDMTLYAYWQVPVTGGWQPPVQPSNPTVPSNPTPSTPSTPTTPPNQTVVNNPDGSTTTTTNNPTAGTVTEVTKFADGTTTIVVTDKNGNVDVEVKASEEVLKNDTVVTLPRSCSDADTLDISVFGDQTVTVEIPVENATPGTVIVIIHADGTEEVVRKTMITKSGLVVELTGDVTIKVEDRSMKFDDVSATYWGRKAVDFVSSRGIMTGDGTGNFNTNALLNRASLAVLLHNLENRPDSTSSKQYTDVTASWYIDAVEWVTAMGIMDGKSDGTFGVNDNITREQFALALYRFAGAPGSTGSVAGFSDSADVSSWAVEAMSWAIANGIISGSGDNLNPQGYATRVEIATMLMRFMTMD